MRFSGFSARCFGGAFLTLFVPLTIAGCGGGGGRLDLNKQTVRGVVLRDTGIGVTDLDPLAGLIPVAKGDINVLVFERPAPPPFDETPYPKTDAKGQFIITPYRGGYVFNINIKNRCSTTAQVGVDRDGEIYVVTSSTNNFNGALPPLQQRAREVFEALQASTSSEKPDVLILVSDQQDACSE